MGKGQIISGGTDGEYSLRLDYDTSRIDTLVARIDARIALYEAQIDALLDENAIARRKLWIAGLQKRRGILQDAPEDRVVGAWCADLSEELSGDVGTIEIASQTNKVVIRPGYGGNAVHDAARDGQMQAMVGQETAAAMLNWMMHDARQKWKPRHRIGTITAIDTETDTCSLTLDAAEGAMTGEDVNRETALAGVAVDYMTCNARAFSVDDRVVVEFRDNDWSDPVVIGFESNPQACDVYLRVSVNGTVCSYTLGNKRIRIVQENETTGEMEQVGDAQDVVTTDMGICGPFTGIDLDRPFYAELYYRSTNFYLSRLHYWFPYFEVGTAADYTFHLRTALYDDGNSWLRNAQSKAHLDFSNGDTYPMTSGDIVESQSWYLKRVEWMRSDEGDLRSVAAAQLVTGSHGTLRVLPVDFSCKVIRWRHTGWTGDAQESYEACAAHGDVFTIYDPIDCNPIHIDANQWNYFAAFLGDERDGCWDRLGDLYHGLPETTFTATQDIFDFWNNGGLEWFVSGNWFLKYWGADNWSALSTPPFIVTDENGGIVSTPADDVLRVANIKQYSVGYCNEWDAGGDCIGYEMPCGDWVVVNDDERHEYTFEVVDLPTAFI